MDCPASACEFPHIYDGFYLLGIMHGDWRVGGAYRTATLSSIPFDFQMVHLISGLAVLFVSRQCMKSMVMRVCLATIALLMILKSKQKKNLCSALWLRLETVLLCKGAVIGSM